MSACASAAPELPPVSGYGPLPLAEANATCESIRSELAATDQAMASGRLRALELDRYNSNVAIAGAFASPAFALSKGMADTTAVREAQQRKRDRLEYVLNQRKCG